MIADSAPRERRLEAAIFDMDGLLIDSEPLWREAEREIFASVGLELSEADCEATMGWRTDEVTSHWFARRPWSGPGPAAVATAIETRVSELVVERGAMMPGVGRTLAELARRGLRLGLATSSAPRLIETVIRTLQLGGVFEVRCSAMDEPAGKPDPAVFLTTARRLGVAPASCIVFEDSVAGVAAARAAGMRVVAVPAPNLLDHPGFVPAELILPSLEAFSPERIGLARTHHR